MYSSCANALHTVRKECVDKSGPELQACMREKNVHTTSEEVRGCDAAIRCESAGDTAARFACVSDATAPQRVYGLPLHGAPTRVIH